MHVLGYYCAALSGKLHSHLRFSQLTLDVTIVLCNVAAEEAL